jgi:hypothetical protein
MIDKPTDLTKKDGQASFFGATSVFLIAIFFCWLLSLAYPEGLINEETITYWLLQKDFHWLSANQLDWYRTIPYGALLALSTKLSNPTNALYWFNSLIFSLNFAFVFVLGLMVFASRRAAFSLALSALLFEVASMRMFYNNLGISPDALMGEAIFLGVLLCLVGWMKRSVSMLLLAYAIFGMVAFMKPIGIAIWPLFIAFAIAFSLRRAAGTAKSVVLMTLGTTLLISPLLLWCLRNYFVYGFATSSAFGGTSYLRAVLPLVSNHERLFDDEKTNWAFHRALRTCEKENRDHLMELDENLNENLARQFLYERYFITGPAKNNPFQVILSVTNPDWHGVGSHEIYELQQEHMFKVNREAGRLAWQIIRDHPLEYVQLVMREYVSMFAPLEIWSNPFYNFQSDPSVAYDFWDSTRQGTRREYPELFMGKAYGDGSGSVVYVAKALGAVVNNRLWQSILELYYRCEFWLCHLIALGAWVLWLQAPRYSKWFPSSMRLRWVAMTLLVLFVCAASINLCIASCQITRLRYQLASEMEVHLMFFLTIVTASLALSPKLRAAFEAKVQPSVTGKESILAKIKRYFNKRIRPSRG